ncbi:hypothetical protein [Limnoglobus roseus]|uniref:Uncharacterized protein n=1 Tax=Limnoglobus roseus TaxID=2598579 RepID=A0A5C1AIA4_9BACT|nr:hypothetical protein [Limnoglobus roseus]QEL19159.1 hypothetical protein PX52LOC_06217 [Limnoglobus roseus]
MAGEDKQPDRPDRMRRLFTGYSRGWITDGELARAGMDTLAECRAFSAVRWFLGSLSPAAVLAAEDYARLLTDPSRPSHVETGHHLADVTLRAQGLARRSFAEAILAALHVIRS